MIEDIQDVAYWSYTIRIQFDNKFFVDELNKCQPSVWKPNSEEAPCYGSRNVVILYHFLPMTQLEAERLIFSCKS